MNTLNRILVFFRVVDSHDGLLSLTNLAVIIVLIKLVLAPTVSLLDLGALLISILNYAGKKVINKSNQEVPEVEDTITPQIEQMKSKVDEALSQVSALALKSGIKRME